MKFLRNEYKVFKQLEDVGFFEEPNKKWKYVDGKILISKEHYELFIEFLSNSSEFNGEFSEDSLEDIFLEWNITEKAFLNDLKNQSKNFKSMLPYEVDFLIRYEDYPLQNKIILDIVKRYLSIDKSVKELNMDFEKGKVELTYDYFSRVLCYLKDEFKVLYEDKFMPEMYNDNAQYPHWIIEDLKEDFDEYTFLAKLKHPKKFFKAVESYTENCVFKHRINGIYDEKNDNLFFKLALDFMEDWFIPVNQGYK